MDSEEPRKSRPYPEPSGIKSWAEEDRPREKLSGRKELTESELLAILIGSGTKNFTAVDVAKLILKQVNNDLNELAKLSPEDLQSMTYKTKDRNGEEIIRKIPGLGKARAITIVAAMRLARKLHDAPSKDKSKIRDSKDAFTVLFPKLADKPHEEFWIMLLNRANKVIETIRISSGGLTGTVADVRMIFEHAIKSRATSIMLCHNHPSGNLSPSQLDIDLTKKLVKAGETLDVKVLDHLIIGDGKYYSFADEGMM